MMFQDYGSTSSLKSILEISKAQNYTNIIKLNNIDSMTEQYITIGNPITLLFENSNLEKMIYIPYPYIWKSSSWIYSII